jgi:hypothetical protein
MILLLFLKKALWILCFLCWFGIHLGLRGHFWDFRVRFLLIRRAPFFGTRFCIFLFKKHMPFWVHFGLLFWIVFLHHSGRCTKAASLFDYFFYAKKRPAEHPNGSQNEPQNDPKWCSEPTRGIPKNDQESNARGVFRPLRGSQIGEKSNIFSTSFVTSISERLGSPQEPPMTTSCRT